MNFNFGHFSAKYQGYSLTFWPKLAHFHHFSISYQNQRISISVILSAKYQAIALYLAKIGSFSSLFNLISKSMNSISVIFRQHTKPIDLLFGQNWLISSLFNLISKSMNFNFGHFSAKYQGYSLTFWPKLAHFHHFSNLISKSMNFKFGQCSAKIPRL